MKDKLRELAAEWLRKGEFSKNSGAPRCGGQMIEDAAELLAILDVEGDGVAGDWQEKVNEIANNIGESLNAGCDQDAVDRINVYVDELFALATHPARSGVVSDEDVEAALKIWNDAPALGRDEDDAYAMRAALEHFAKGERHDR